MKRNIIFIDEINFHHEILLRFYAIFSIAAAMAQKKKRFINNLA